MSQALSILLRVRRRAGADRRRRLAGSPIRQQPPRRQHQSRPDAAAGGDRRRRGRRPPAAGAGPARQYRTSADDRRPDRHRRGTQHRPRQPGREPMPQRARCRRRRAAAPDCAAARRRLERARARGRSCSTMPSRKCPSRRRGRLAPPLPTKCAARRRRCRNGAANAPIRSQASPRSRWPAGPSPARAARRNRCRRGRLSRNEPMMPRPLRPSRSSRRPPPVRAPERAAAPPPPPRRRPHRTPTRISPKWRNGWKPRCAGRPVTRLRRRSLPPVAPEPPPAPPRRPRRREPTAAPPAPAEERLRKSRRRDGVPAGPSEDPFVRSAKVPRRVLFLATLIAAGSLTGPALAQDISINLGQGNGGVTERAIQLIALLTVLSIAPSILIMMTSFTRIVVVLSLLAHGARHRDRAAEFRHHRAGDVPHRVRDGTGAAEILRRRHQAAGRQRDRRRGRVAAGVGAAARLHAEERAREGPEAVHGSVAANRRRRRPRRCRCAFWCRPS